MSNMITHTFKKMLAVCAFLLINIAGIFAQQRQPVVITQNNETATMSNGVVMVVIEKASSNIISLKYHGAEMMGHGGGYWVTLGEISGNPTIQGISFPGNIVSVCFQHYERPG
jgi:hypothetical protein